MDMSLLLVPFVGEPDKKRHEAAQGGVLDLLIFLSTHDRTRRLRVWQGKRLVQR
jgi:hypothetical protein